MTWDGEPGTYSRPCPHLGGVESFFPHPPREEFKRRFPVPIRRAPIETGSHGKNEHH